MNVAHDLDPLVGRADDVDAILGLIEHERLVSLVAPGGAGKTRLAKAVIERWRSDGREAWLVDATSLRDSEFLIPAIANAMRLGEGVTHDALAAVAAALDDRDALVTLDNLEQLDAGDVVGALLDAAPNVRLLVTSRVPLRVRGEREYAVPTLSLPDGDSPEAVERSSTGQLFLTRARAIGRLNEPLDEESAQALAALLVRLDGLPLAIELAAARTRILHPSEIADRLERDGASAIDGGSTPDRSLAAILEWTIGLLSPDQADALRAVSVFATFDLEMGEALLPGRSVAAAVESLAALGLVRFDPAVEGVTRFRLLETVRSEAWRQVDVPERREIEDRAIACVERIANTTVARLVAGDVLAIDRLEADVDNVRMALDNLAAREPRRALALWTTLAPLWSSGGRGAEGMARFERYAAAAPEPSAELASALVTYGSSVLGVRSEAANREILQRALAVARETGDISIEIRGLSVLASSLVNAGDVDAVQDVQDRLVELEPDLVTPIDQMRVFETQHLIAGTLHGLGSDESLEPLLRAVAEGDGRAEPMARLGILGNLALVHLMRGEAAECLVVSRQATALARGLRSHLLPWCLGTQAMAEAESGLVDASIGTLDEAIALSLANASVVHVMDRLLSSEAVCLAAGRPLLVASAFGAVLAMDASGVELPPDDRVLADRFADRARSKVKQIDFELAIRDGQGADPVALLASIPDALRASSPGPTGPMTTRRHGELTRRELEILALVGAGRTDPEIADALFISPKTASVHVANIKGKLGFERRLEVALYARDVGLAEAAKRS